MPQEIKDLAQQVRTDCFVAVRELKACAKTASAKTPKEMQATLQFLEIINKLIGEITFNLAALHEAKTFLQETIKQTNDWEEL